MGVLAVLLVIVSGMVLFAGVGSLSQATVGVGILICACYLLILARLCQALWVYQDAQNHPRS